MILLCQRDLEHANPTRSYWTGNNGGKKVVPSRSRPMNSFIMKTSKLNYMWKLISKVHLEGNLGHLLIPSSMQCTYDGEKNRYCTMLRYQCIPNKNSIIEYVCVLPYLFWAKFDKISIKRRQS